MCLEWAGFRENFPVSGRFPRFKNPVNYKYYLKSTPTIRKNSPPLLVNVAVLSPVFPPKFFRNTFMLHLFKIERRSPRG